MDIKEFAREARPMTMQKFISQNHRTIDTVIRAQCSNCSLDDSERMLWILNDESLYRWAQSEGVDI